MLSSTIFAKAGLAKRCMKSITVVVIKLAEPVVLSNECLRFTVLLYHIGLNYRAACGQAAPKNVSTRGHSWVRRKDKIM